MRVAPECFPCFLEQIKKAGRMAGIADEDVLKLTQELPAALKPVSPRTTPAELGGIAYRLLSRIAGADPYRRVKRDCIREALDLFPAVKALVAASDDHLLSAAKAAIAGNVIDFGVGSQTDLTAKAERAMHQPLAIDHYQDFKRRLAQARSVLYLADNAGETVFDRILIERLGRPVTYAVRESPIINDATLEDAVLSGVDAAARIVSSGCSTPGTIPSLCSDGFRRILGRRTSSSARGRGTMRVCPGSACPSSSFSSPNADP